MQLYIFKITAMLLWGTAIDENSMAYYQGELPCLSGAKQ